MPGYPARVSEIPAEAASGEATSTETGKPAETAAGADAHQGIDRKDGLWALAIAVACAALGSFCGYLAKPLSPSPSHTGLVQGLELSGMLFFGVLFVVMVIICVHGFRPARPAFGQKEAAEEAEKKELQETPYDFRADQRDRHRTLIWAVPVTLAIAAVGALVGYLGFPGVSDPHQSFAGKLAAGGAGFLGLLTLCLVGGCIYAAWPARVYGPKRKLPTGVLALKLIGFWLAMFPFSLFCLIAIAAGTYQGVEGAWVKMIIMLIVGLVFGAACCFLLAGSGALRGEELKPGGEVSEAVRKSSWWHHFLLMLTLWALFVTGVAMVFAVRADWSDFADAFGTAIASWVARIKAGSGEMPEEEFQL